MRRLLLIAWLAFCAGCGGSVGPAPASAPTAGPSAETAEGESPAMKVQGIDLLVHDSGATAGEARKPLFQVHAEKVTMGENGLYDFEKAQAVVHGRERKEDDITFEAQRGRYEEERGATLQGDVVGRAGVMTLRLADVTWEKNEAAPRGMVFSNQALRLESHSMDLMAESMRIYPEDKSFVLSGVSGTIDFGRK